MDYFYLHQRANYENITGDGTGAFSMLKIEIQLMLQNSIHLFNNSVNVRNVDKHRNKIILSNLRVDLFHRHDSRACAIFRFGTKQTQRIHTT